MKMFIFIELKNNNLRIYWNADKEKDPSKVETKYT